MNNVQVKMIAAQIIMGDKTFKFSEIGIPDGEASSACVYDHINSDGRFKGCSEVDFLGESYETTIENLEKLGWEFGDWYVPQNNETDEEAEARTKEEYVVWVRFTENERTLYSGYSQKRNENFDWADSGDDMKTICDIRKLVSEGKAWEI